MTLHLLHDWAKLYCAVVYCAGLDEKSSCGFVKADKFPAYFDNRKEFCRTTCLIFVRTLSRGEALARCCCSQCLCFLWIRLNIQICNFTQTKGDVFCIRDAVSKWWTIKMWNEKVFLYIFFFNYSLQRGCTLEETQDTSKQADKWQKCTHAIGVLLYKSHFVTQRFM